MSAVTNLVFVTGRGGAGFHMPDAALTQGWGSIFRVMPARPLSGAHPHSFRRPGPICYHVLLTGTCLGYGWGEGLSQDRGRECQKRDRALRRGVGRGEGKGPGPAFFQALCAL